MAVLNRISGTLGPERQAKDLKHLEEVAKDLDFRASVRAEDVRSLFKAGKEYSPFLEKAFSVMNEHPEIVPGAFPSEEFRKDYALLKELEPIASAVDQLAESLQKTMMALGSDAMGAALEIYHAAKYNASHVPGLAASVSDMAVYFAKPRRTAAASKGASKAAGA